MGIKSAFRWFHTLAAIGIFLPCLPVVLHNAGYLPAGNWYLIMSLEALTFLVFGSGVSAIGLVTAPVFSQGCTRLGLDAPTLFAVRASFVSAGYLAGPVMTGLLTDAFSFPIASLGLAIVVLIPAFLAGPVLTSFDISGDK
jgi:hypothetical protein